MSSCRNYPHDSDRSLDGLVFSVYDFDEDINRGELHVCKDCHKCLLNRKISVAALMNGFWVAEIPRKFQGATVVEHAAAYAVHIKGYVIALESRKVRNVSGSAHRSLRDSSMFVTSDSCSVGEELPLAATGLLHMTTIVLAGKGKPTESQLKGLLGARKHIVRDVIDYQEDKDDHLVNGFTLARKASMNEVIFETYPCDGGVPPKLLDGCLNPRGPKNLRRRATSSYTNDRRGRGGYRRRRRRRRRHRTGMCRRNPLGEWCTERR